MTDSPPTNFERLVRQLKVGSLAARLLGAYISTTPATQQAALKTVITDRLNEIRQAHAGTADQ